MRLAAGIVRRYLVRETPEAGPRAPHKRSLCLSCCSSLLCPVPLMPAFRGDFC